MVLATIITVAVVLLVIMLFLFMWLSDTDAIGKWTRMQVEISRHRKEVELERLKALEKNPELKVHIVEK